MATDNTKPKLIKTESADVAGEKPKAQQLTARPTGNDISFCCRCGEFVTGPFCPGCGAKQCISCGN
ncbi:MAG: hypothetical protein ABSH20_26325 [Tepidisphaeraceae bacterium]